MRGLRSKKKDDKAPGAKPDALKSVISETATTTGGGSSAADEVLLIPLPAFTNLSYRSKFCRKLSRLSSKTPTLFENL